MLRYLCLAAFVATAVLAFGDSEEGESVTVKEFKEEMMQFREEILGASNKLGHVENMASEAMKDPTGKAWIGVAEAYGKLGTEVAETFGEEAGRLVDLSTRIWSSNTDFAHDEMCSDTYNLYHMKEHVDWLEARRAFAFISDMSCLKSKFAEAEKIKKDLEHMEPGEFTESDALEMIYDILVRMQRIKMAGTRFHETLVAFHEDGDSKEADKRALSRLYRLLGELKDDKRK